MNDVMYSFNINKFINKYVKAKMEDNIIEWDLKDNDINKKSVEDKKLYKDGKLCKFCVYKTNYENRDSVLMWFCLYFNKNDNISYITSTTMSLLDIIENTLYPVDYCKIKNDLTDERVNKRVVIIRLIKQITSDDGI